MDNKLEATHWLNAELQRTVY